MIRTLLTVIFLWLVGMVDAQEQPSELKVKRMAYALNPTSVVVRTGPRDIGISMSEFDRYPITDSAFYSDKLSYLSMMVHVYLKDSGNIRLTYGVFPRGVTDPKKALRYTVDLAKRPPAHYFNLGEKLQALVKLLPIAVVPGTTPEFLSIGLEDESVKYLPLLKSFFNDRLHAFQYRMVVGCLLVDFVMDRKTDLFRVAQVKQIHNGEVIASEAYDAECSYIKDALTRKFN